MEEFESLPQENFLEALPKPGHAPRLMRSEGLLPVPLASFMTLSELYPLNYSALVAAQGAFNNHAISVLSFAGATLVTEIAGAIGSANLLSSNQVSKRMEKVHRKVERIYPSNEPTSRLTDFIMTVAGGTVQLNIFKYLQEPERDLSKSIKYSVAMGIGNSAVSGAGVALLYEAVAKPNPLSTIGGGLAFFGLFSASRYLRHKFSRSKNKNISVG